MATATNRPNRGKKKRSPIGRRNVLKSEKRDGFVRRFVNDEPGRIQAFLDAGYTIVNDGSQSGDENVGEASQVGSNTGKPVGGGMRAVLMEIPEEFYTEDQQAKQAQIKEKEAGLLNDESGQAPNMNGLYGDGINIKSNRPTIQSS